MALNSLQRADVH